MQSLRRFDRMTTADPRAFKTASGPAFYGRWLGTDPGGQSFAQLVISPAPAEGGGLHIHGRSPEGAGSIAWANPTAITVYSEGPASPTPIAFSARRTCDGYDGLLHGNLNLGLLVLATFKIPHDGSRGYFAREFFARSETDPRMATPEEGDDTDLFAAVEEPETVDLDPMLGRWHNAEHNAPGIRTIEVERAGDGLAVRAQGSGGRQGPTTWGEAKVEVFACRDETGGRSLATLASWDFGFMETQLQLRVPAGVLALCSFNVFKDESGRADYCIREFFYRL